jgi:ribosomal protein L11 methyltransferase
VNSDKTWVEISLPVNDTIEDAITNFLFELGAVGCQAQGEVLRGYFLSEEWSDQKSLQFCDYLKQIYQLGFSLETDQFEIQKIENQDWNAEWKKSYKPIEIGGRFIIKPSWIKQKQDTSKEVIEIDPQMAFGTGTHATTQLVLELLLEIQQPPRTILDIGTGTGILAIAAARLFDSKIYVFDNDFTAVSTAQQNFVNNNVVEKIELFCGENINLNKVRFDLILANINRSIIIQLLPEISEALIPNGKAIFSGILNDEKEQVLGKLNFYSLGLISELKMDEWVGFVVEKLGS